MKHQRTLCHIASILLFLALFSWPYGYYVFLRWAVTLIAVYVAVANFKKGHEMSAFFMIGIGILFNPFVQVTMTKSSWSIFDFVTAFVFLAFANTDD